MDLEEWELLPDDGFLEIQNDGGEKIFSRRFHDPRNMFQMDYFICPSSGGTPPEEFVEPTGCSSRVPKQLVPLSVQLESSEEVVKEVITKDPPIVDQFGVVKSSSGSLMKNIKAAPDAGALLETDHDPISQVFFKKMKENEFVDMKMDSPKSGSKGLIPQVDPGTLQFEKPIRDEALEGKNSLPEPENDKKIEIKKHRMARDSTWEENLGGLKIWKWRLNGFGAICSFGAAAATICIIIIGGRQKNNQLLDHHKQQQTRKAQFHIYTEDKGIKQVVHATRLNEAISAVRGLPVARAHITFGGYFDGV